MNGVAARPRVLHLLGRMQRGGAEMRLVEVLARLCPSEFHADVCVLSGLSGDLDEQVRACGGAVIPLRLNPAFPLRFLRLLRRGRYDAVHSHVLHASGALLALAAAAGVRVRIAHFRAMGDGRCSTPRRRLQRWLMLRLIDRFATHVVGCGEGAMNAVWRAGWQADSRCRIVYNAVNGERFALPVDRGRVRAGLGVPPRSRVFLHVGNEVAEKNHRRLLSIFQAIAAVDPEAWFVLVGAGTDRPDGVCARLLAECEARPRVVTLGVRDDVPRLLAAADVLLLPSLREGLPGIVLEACAAGVPVLASDLPGVREIASRIPLVEPLSLAAADPEWARAALALPEQAERLNLRHAAVERFRASEFHIDRSVEAYRSLWRGAPGGSVHAC